MSIVSRSSPTMQVSLRPFARPGPLQGHLGTKGSNISGILLDIDGLLSMDINWWIFIEFQYERSINGIQMDTNGISIEVWHIDGILNGIYTLWSSWPWPWFQSLGPCGPGAEKLKGKSSNSVCA